MNAVGPFAVLTMNCGSVDYMRLGSAVMGLLSGCNDLKEIL